MPSEFLYITVFHMRRQEQSWLPVLPGKIAVKMNIWNMDIIHTKRPLFSILHVIEQIVIVVNFLAYIWKVPGSVLDGTPAILKSNTGRSVRSLVVILTELLSLDFLYWKSNLYVEIMN